MRDWVHEDDVLAAAGLPGRAHCLAAFEAPQAACLAAWWQRQGCPDSVKRVASPAGGAELPGPRPSAARQRRRRRRAAQPR